MDGVNLGQAQCHCPSQTDSQRDEEVRAGQGQTGMSVPEYHPSLTLLLLQKQEALHVVGLAMCDSMMARHPHLRKNTTSASITDMEDSEKDVSTNPSSNTTPSKHAQVSSHCKSSKHLRNILMYMEQLDKHLEKEEKHREWEVQHIEQQEQLQEHMVELVECAVGLQAQH